MRRETNVHNLDDALSELVHVTRRRLEKNRLLDRYILDRVERLSSKGYGVLWYELILERSTRCRRRGRCRARVVAHLPRADISATREHSAPRSAVRDAFASLAHQLWHVRDVRKAQDHATPVTAEYASRTRTIPATPQRTLTRAPCLGDETRLGDETGLQRQTRSRAVRGEFDCASCGATEALSLERGVAFCRECLDRGTQSNLDPLYDDLGTRD